MDRLLDPDMMFYRGAILSDKEIAVLEKGFDGPVAYSDDEFVMHRRIKSITFQQRTK